MMVSSTTNMPPTIFISAGEASGEHYGAAGGPIIRVTMSHEKPWQVAGLSVLFRGIIPMTYLANRKNSSHGKIAKAKIGTGCKR